MALRTLKQFFNKQFSSQKDLVNYIHETTGLLPVRIDYYQQVFKHKSKHREPRINNERLELLGDAVLNAIVTDYLYMNYPEKEEGFLTSLKSKIVSRKMLNEIGQKLNLLDKLSYHKGSVQQDPAVLFGNTFEALVGAIYLDLGYEAAYEFVEGKMFGEMLDLDEIERMDFDFKSKLYIYAQRNNLSLDYKLIKESEKDNRKYFTIAVILDNKEVAQGSGFNKKEAEQVGSKVVIDELKL